MAIAMTNRLLALVIAVALSATVAARAVQASYAGWTGPRLGLRLPSHLLPLDPQVAPQVPGVLQTAAVSLGRSAQQTLDPKSSLLRAYQRDHDALERMRQRASGLRQPARAAYNRLLDSDQQALATLERQALDYQSGDAAAAEGAMDQVVLRAEAALAKAQTAGYPPSLRRSGA
jgi:hypothetical protein